jgi:hypothetical protein
MGAGHEVLEVFREIWAVEADDGVTFDAGSLAIDRNREELEYGGLRITGNASVGGAKVRVVVDIGYGDATEPGLIEISLPVLLDAPAPKLKAYPKETVIAEKLQIPAETPDALTDAFAEDQTKQAQWKAFVAGVASVAGKPADFKTVITELREFLELHMASARTMAKSEKPRS